MDTLNSTITFTVDPIGKPRMTQRDKWKKRAVVERYFAYRDVVRLQANLEKFEISGELDITFHLPVTKSYKEKQKTAMHGLPHTSKPDIDNLLKAFLDCFDEDKGVHTIKAKKIWTKDFGKIEVSFKRM